MQIIIASSNQGKIKEIKKLLPSFETIPFKNIVGDIEIIEDGNSFKDNAIIKVKAIEKELRKINYNKSYIILADDSGISVPALDNAPGIYSARYAGENATDKTNNQKLLQELQKKNLTKTDAFYTAAIAILYKNNIYTTHGWMYGEVINQEKGENGFGYDPLFIPIGHNKTLGELTNDIKKDLSHRTKALNLMMIIINKLTSKNYKNVETL